MLDLLLFHVEQLRYVVGVDLKIRFDPAPTSCQLETYLTRSSTTGCDAATGTPHCRILLCKGRNDTLVRYALACVPARLAVADYTYDTLAAQERRGLPTAQPVSKTGRPVSRWRQRVE